MINFQRTIRAAKVSRLHSFLPLRLYALMSAIGLRNRWQLQATHLPKTCRRRRRVRFLQEREAVASCPQSPAPKQSPLAQPARASWHHDRVPTTPCRASPRLLSGGRRRFGCRPGRPQHQRASRNVFGSCVVVVVAAAPTAPPVRRTSAATARRRGLVGSCGAPCVGWRTRTARVVRL